MLGLTSCVHSSSFVNNEPPGLTFIVNPTLTLVRAPSDDSGDGTVITASTTSFDIRLFVNTADFNEGVDQASDFTLTNVRITNSTTSVTQTVASSATMDNFLDFGGFNSLYFFTDAGGPLDDLDFSSDSGQAAAHSGTGNNSFQVFADLQRVGFSGSLSIQSVPHNLANA